ncbi:MAG: hypothetical protein Q8P93_02515 [bacterium]|nr:hypothetical protein [bacterium]
MAQKEYRVRVRDTIIRVVLTHHLMDSAAEFKSMLVHAFGEISDQLTKVDKRLGDLEVYLEKVGPHLKAMSARLDAIDERLDTADLHMQRLESTLTLVAEHTETMAADLRVFKNEVMSEFKELSPRAFERAIDREDLEVRVLYLENRLGIISGK